MHTMSIIQAVIVTDGQSPDKVGISTNMPDPRGISQNLVLSFTCKVGTGEDYVRRNFAGVHYDVIRRNGASS
jgi:hypothetical protein